MQGKQTIETLNELKIWIEGQFQLASEARQRLETDVTLIRTRQHELSNEITKIGASFHNLGFAALKELVSKHDVELEKFSDERLERKGAIRAIKATWAIGGASVGVVSTVLAFASRFIHI